MAFFSSSYIYGTSTNAFALLFASSRNFVPVRSVRSVVALNEFINVARVT